MWSPKLQSMRAMYSKVCYLISIFLALLAVSCGGSGGGGSNVVPAPTGLSATYNPSLLQIALTWTPPNSVIQGYNVEAAIGDQPFHQVNNGLIDAQATLIFVTFSARPPEAITIQLRLQALSSGVPSAWSNVAQTRTPILEPDAGQSEFDPAARAVTVSWHVVSSAAVQTRVERALSDKNQSIIGPWVTLSTQPPQTQVFIDRTVEEARYYAYRVTNIVGSFESSATLILNPRAIPLFLPNNLTGATVPQGIQLNWKNFSTLATNITILRGGHRETPSTELAILGAGVQSYLDTTASFGYYSYALKISDGTNPNTSPSIVLAAPNPPGALSVQPTIITTGTESIIGAAMRSDGIWALADRTGPFEIKAAQGQWPQWLATNWYAYGPGPIKINNLGRPVLLYFRSDPQSPSMGSLDKVTYDGAAWLETQIIGSLPTTYASAAPPQCSWRLDPTDDIHAVLTTYDLSTNYKVPTATYLHATPSGVELNPLNIPKNVTYSELFLDSENRPHLVLLAPFDHTISEWWPGDIPGTWNKATILSDPFLDRIFTMTVLGTSGDSAWVIAATSASSSPYKAGLQGLHKVGGTWLPPQTLYSMPSPSAPYCIGMAQSHDGSRTAILIWDTGVGLVALNKSGEAWIPNLVGPPQSVGLAIAFDASNRLHILSIDPTSMQLVDYHEK